MREAIATNDGPKAIGPYSQAIKANGFVFLSGQIPLDPATQQLISGDVAAQTERVLQNLAGILKAAGSSLRAGREDHRLPQEHVGVCRHERSLWALLHRSAARALHGRGGAPAQRCAGGDRRHRARLTGSSAALNLTDRIYVAVHVALTVLVCAALPARAHWPWYVAWNLCAIAVDPAARSQAARRRRLGVRPRLAAGRLLHHRVRRSLVSVALTSKRLAERSHHFVRIAFVRRATGFVDASPRCDMAGPVPGIRLLRVLSAVPGCGRPLLDLA